MFSMPLLSPPTRQITSHATNRWDHSQVCTGIVTAQKVKNHTPKKLSRMSQLSVSVKQQSRSQSSIFRGRRVKVFPPYGQERVSTGIAIPRINVCLSRFCLHLRTCGGQEMKLPPDTTQGEYTNIIIVEPVLLLFTNRLPRNTVHEPPLDGRLERVRRMKTTREKGPSSRSLLRSKGFAESVFSLSPIRVICQELLVHISARENHKITGFKHNKKACMCLYSHVLFKHSCVLYEASVPIFVFAGNIVLHLPHMAVKCGVATNTDHRFTVWFVHTYIPFSNSTPPRAPPSSPCVCGQCYPKRPIYWTMWLCDNFVCVTRNMA